MIGADDGVMTRHMRRSIVGIFIVAGLAASALLAAVAVRPARNTVTIAEVQARIKHVFVIYQENESFDHYFGTYPGADNLASAQARSHGFRQYDAIGRRWVTPFRITNPNIASPAHSRPVLIAKMDGGRMDRFVAAQERHTLSGGDNRTDAQRLGLLTMSYYDCNTIPFLWKYARRFALFDRIFQGMTGPSTPGNIELIAAQTGESQWARDPSEASVNANVAGEPVVNDMPPAQGPYRTGVPKRHQFDQRYATQMLTLTGRDDSAAHIDTRGVRKDLRLVGSSGRPPISWGWYQEGYNGPGAKPSRGYETHHNAPDYFGYLRDNPVFWRNVHNVRYLLAQIANGTLGSRSVAYIKGGSRNEFGWRPTNTAVGSNFLGDDDHPGYGDSGRQIAESFVATFVNAIAHSRYWKDSAIIITWDDSGGFYDHVPPPRFERCPDGHPCGDGPRLPFLLISPYTVSGKVVHDTGDTASVVKFIDAVFGLPPLASLPDERPYLPRGPRDANPRITNLLGGFDAARLTGQAAPIPASAAEIPAAVVNRFPAPMNCKTLGIRPVSIPGVSPAPPPGYAPRRLLNQP